MLKTTMYKLADIKKNPNNPRVVNDDKFKKLVKSIQEFPKMLEIRPIVVNSDNIVLGGNMRLKACKEAGLTEVPVIMADDLTDEQQKQFIIKDNVGFGEWDWEMLANDWDTDELEEWGLDVPDMFMEEEEETTGDDDAPEVPEIPETVLGDLWELGDHRLLCGDSTSVTDVDKLIDSQTIDLVHTDPPYGINEKGDRSNRGGACQGSKLEDFQDDTIQYAIDAFNICDAMNIKRQVWWGANYYAHHIPQTNNWFVWDKRVEEKQKDTQSDCELAYVKSKWSSVRIFRHLWKGMIKESERGQKRVHPTQKPIALAEWVYSYYNDVNSVLDLFGGSGFNLIASEKTGKKSFTMEFSPHYCDVIVKRYINFCKENNRPFTVKLNGEKYEGALLDG